jgi:hypothetical protein
MQLHQLPKLDVEGSNPFARLDLRQVPILVAPRAAPDRQPDQLAQVLKTTQARRPWATVGSLGDAA